MKVSVITVTYNSSQTIFDTIESINNQDYKDIEHVFVDGMSNDETVKLIKLHTRRNFKLISKKDKGVYDAMNTGINISTGKIIFILNSDDILCDNQTVSKIVKLFELNKSIQIVYGPIKISKQNNLNYILRNWEVDDFYSGCFLNGWHPPHPGFVTLRSVYKKYGKYKIDLKIASDFELMLRLMEVKKLNAAKANFYISIMRSGGKSSTVNGIINTIADIKSSFQKNGIKINLLRYFFFRYLNKIIQFFK